MDEARASAAIDISGPAVHASFEADLPPGAIADFDSDLAEEFFRAVANSAKLTLHVRVEAGTNAHHMVEASFKAFARALRAAVALDPAVAGHPLHQGAPVSAAGSRSSTTAWATCARWRRRFEHVGAEAAVTNDHDAGARRGRHRAARAWAPCRRRWSAIRRARASTTCSRERVELGVPVIGICLGMQLLFECSTELGGAEGSACSAARSRPLERPGLKVPQIGWNPIALAARVAALPGAARPVRLLPRALLRARVRPTPADTLGTADYGSEFVSAVEREPVYGVQFHPEKSGPDGLRLLGNFTGICGLGRPQPCRMILLPAIDIRDGKAVRLRAGRLRRRDRLRGRPARGGASFVEAGARFLHVVDLDGAREGQPVNLDHLRRITRELDVPVQYGGGLRTLQAVREALAAGAERVVVGTAAYSDPELRRRAARDLGAPRS